MKMLTWKFHGKIINYTVLMLCEVHREQINCCIFANKWILCYTIKKKMTSRKKCTCWIEICTRKVCVRCACEALQGFNSIILCHKRRSWRGCSNPIFHLKFWQNPSPSWIFIRNPSLSYKNPSPWSGDAETGGQQGQLPSCLLSAGAKGAKMFFRFKGLPLYLK